MGSGCRSDGRLEHAQDGDRHLVAVQVALLQHQLRRAAVAGLAVGRAAAVRPVAAQRFRLDQPQRVHLDQAGCLAERVGGRRPADAADQLGRCAGWFRGKDGLRLEGWLESGDENRLRWLEEGCKPGQPGKPTTGDVVLIVNAGDLLVGAEQPLVHLAQHAQAVGEGGPLLRVEAPALHHQVESG